MKKYKLGDRVKTVQLGECTIVGIDTDACNPYMYDVIGDLDPEETESYTSDWKYSVNDAYSSLIGEQKKIHPIIIGRWMLVSDSGSGGDWVKRFVIKKLGKKVKSRYLVFANVENEEDLVYADDTIIYDYAKELESEIEEQINSHKQQIDKMFKNL